MQHLHHLYAHNEQEFRKLLGENIAVNIKIDQMAFVVKREGDNLVYYGKEGRAPITKSKRASMGIYEDAIRHVESKLWKELPNNVEVYLEHFHPGLKMLVEYSSKPKSRLVLSYLKKGERIIRPDDPLTDIVADILDVSPPPVIFSGRLNQQQKDALINFVSLDDEQRINKYGDKNFLPFILSMFTHPQELDWLKEGGYEGVVFYFGKDHPVSAKLVDPTRAGLKREEKATPVNQLTEDLYSFLDKVLSDQVNKALETFNVASERQHTGDTFIDFVSCLTEQFVVDYVLELSTIYDQHAEIARNERFAAIAYNLLPKYMKELVDDHWWAENLFSTLSYLLKGKAKINTRIGITAERKVIINSVIEQLQAKGIL